MSKSIFPKGIAIALSVAIGMSIVMSGCGSKGDSSQTSSSTAQESTQSESVATDTATKLEPATLIWYAPTGGTNPPVDEVLAEANITLQDKLNVTLEAKVLSWGDYEQKMKLIYASGEPWDLCFSASWINNFNQNVSKGNFLDITDLIDKYGTSLKSTVKDSWWSAASYNGRIYGMINVLGHAQMWGIPVKKDIATKYNFDVNKATKLADLEPLLAAVKNGEPGIYPLQTIGDQFLNYVTSQEQVSRYEDLNDFLLLDTKDWKVINKLDVDFIKDGFKLVRSWYEKGYIRKDAPTVQDWYTEACSGKYAVTLPGVVPTKGETKNQNPVEPYKSQFIGLGVKSITTASLQTAMTVVNKNTKNPDRAVMLCNLLDSDKKLFNTLCFGVEGKQWKMTENDIIEPIDASKKSIDEIMTPISVGSIANLMYLTSPYKQEEKELGAKNDKDLVSSPAIGFNYITEPMKTEIANVQATYDKYKAALGAGALDLDKNYSKIQDELKKAGIDKIIVDAQQQIDKFKSENTK